MALPPGPNDTSQCYWETIHGRKQETIKDEETIQGNTVLRKHMYQYQQKQTRTDINHNFQDEIRSTALC